MQSDFFFDFVLFIVVVFLEPLARCKRKLFAVLILRFFDDAFFVYCRHRDADIGEHSRQRLDDRIWRTPRCVEVDGKPTIFFMVPNYRRAGSPFRAPISVRPLVPVFATVLRQIDIDFSAFLQRQAAAESCGFVGRVFHRVLLLVFLILSKRIKRSVLFVEVEVKISFWHFLAFTKAVIAEVVVLVGTRCDVHRVWHRDDFVEIEIYPFAAFDLLLQSGKVCFFALENDSVVCPVRHDDYFLSSARVSLSMVIVYQTYKDGGQIGDKRQKKLAQYRSFSTLPMRQETRWKGCLCCYVTAKQILSEKCREYPSLKRR